ncbi:hypothetical protein LTR85_009622 [Meristemomyces frigidus]|nr:hypothetical protein LTR85_009622 [Meristemomyces frigidus]
MFSLWGGATRHINFAISVLQNLLSLDTQTLPPATVLPAFIDMGNAMSADTGDRICRLLDEFKTGQTQIIARLDGLEAKQSEAITGQQVLTARLDQIAIDNEIKQQALAARLDQMTSDMDVKYRTLRETQLSSAMSRVVQTVDLLEYILDHLPPHTVLFAQRVNSQFKAVIEGSSRLQRKLFFQPQSPDKGQSAPRMNTFLNPFMRHMASTSRNPRLYLINGCLARAEGSEPSATPVRFQSAEHVKTADGSDEVRVHLEQEWPCKGETALARDGKMEELETCWRCMEKWNTQRGSWRSVYISQPPVDTVFAIHSTWNGIQREVPLEDPGAKTLQDMFCTRSY